MVSFDFLYFHISDFLEPSVSAKRLYSCNNKQSKAGDFNILIIKYEMT